jgi:glycosyltransferase involved in cell wall biosynthesis
MWPLLGLQGLATELLDWAGVRLLAATPWTRHTWRNASVRLLQNEDTLARLPASMRPDAVVLNHAMFTEALPSLPRRPQPRTCVAVSALESRKGVALALHALTHARDVTLEVVGDGPERRRLERLAVRLGVADRVVFHGRVPRERLPEYFARAAALVSTGVREEGGMALTEALLSGAPVIVVAHGGARTIAQRADPRRVHLVQPDTLGAMAADMGAAMMRFTNGPIEGDGPALDREASLGVLRGALERALRTRTSGAVAEAPAAAAPLAATH